jgi:flagellar biosynthesis anti-sigma factor FlgM
MATAKNIASAAPDVREARIEELRKRIAAKQYDVKPEDIADKMLSEHLHSHS